MLSLHQQLANLKQELLSRADPAPSKDGDCESARYTLAGERRLLEGIMNTILSLLLAALFLGGTPALAQYTSTLTISGQSNVTIDGATFTTASSHCLVITNSTNITITNSSFTNCAQDAILVSGTSSNITVTYNTFEGVRTGLIAAPSSGTGYVFSYNRCKNINGGTARGQCVQYNGVNGAGNRVQNNYSIAFRGATRNPEDHISMYNSGGTADDYLQVTDNYVEGGGPSLSGSAIVVGDNGGSYINVSENTVVASGNVGIGVAGGSYIIVDNNTIYSHRSDVSHVGLVAYSSTGPCDNITVTNNRIYWWSKQGFLDNTFMPTSGGDECTNRTYSNNTEDSSLVRRRTSDARSAATTRTAR